MGIFTLVLALIVPSSGLVDIALHRRQRLLSIRQGAGLGQAPVIPITGNSTFTEWSVLCEIEALRASGDRADEETYRAEVLRIAELSRLAHLEFLQNTHASSLGTHLKDKGNSSAVATLDELISLGGDYEAALQVFRRNIALRANRVLHPARNAQILSAVINSLIAFNDWRVAERVVDYVGLTSATYLRRGEVGPLVDTSAMAMYLAQRMLELDLPRISWERRGREGPEPSTPRSRGESVQEWLYTQVHRSDLGFRSCDLVLATSRLALRQAVSVDGTAAAVEFCFRREERALLLEAGIPVDDDFTMRWGKVLSADLWMLRTTSEAALPRLIIRT